MKRPRVLRWGGGTVRVPARGGGRSFLALLLVGWGFLWAGCQSTPPTTLSEEERKPYVASGAQPGDVLRITFPGAANLNTTQPVPADGMITLPLGGSLDVRGKTVTELEKALLDLLGPQLVVKEVSVGLESSGYPVFVSGAVLRPGKLQCLRPMTALEVIAESGGFVEGRANLGKVKVVRLEKDGTTRTIFLDLKAALKGESGESFYVRPSDVIHVPERFSFY